MKTVAIQTERFKTKRGWTERRYTVREAMPVEALRLSEDMMALKTAIAALKSVWPDNIRKWPLINLDDRRDAEMDLWNEIHILQRWLRRAEDQMRHRFLKDESKA